MTGYFWAVLGILGGRAKAVSGDMASEEIRDRLDRLLHAILRLAARCLDPGQRITIYRCRPAVTAALTVSRRTAARKTGAGARRGAWTMPLAMCR
jgi:hypothetical protein